MITLDNLAHRYNCLPSEALAKGSTFDLHILDVSAKWARYQNDLIEGRVEKKPKLSQEQMKQMLERVRARDAKR